MWNIIKHKEKNSIFNLLLYLVILAMYSNIMIFSRSWDMDGNSIAFLIWVSFMVTAMKRCLFNLSWYYSNGMDFSLVRQTPSYLKSFLDMLSIKLSDFVLYNMFYTVLRLLPFICATVIFHTTTAQIYYILLFSFMLLLKAYMGPMTTFLASLKIEIYLNNKEDSLKERRELYNSKIASLYPLVNIKIFTLLQKTFLVGYLGILGVAYTVLFPIFFELIDISSSLFLIISISGILLMIIYGVYINQLEKRQDLELHQE